MKLSMAIVIAAVADYAHAQGMGGGGMGGGGTGCQANNPDNYTAPGLKIAPCRGTTGNSIDDQLVYGPFEAGFTSDQTSQFFGCTNNLTLPGGVDTLTAELMVHAAAHEGNCRDGVSIMNECGGHANPFHYHERMTCLYNTTASGHSSSPADMIDGRKLYGKWENENTSTLPMLDACNGHFGVTPDSNGAVVYHYHITDSPPFTAGCFGPAVVNGVEEMVTIAMCREHHNDRCGDGDNMTLTSFDPVREVSIQVPYDLECPCFDGDGSNMGSVPLPFETATTTESTTWDGISDAPISSAPTASPAIHTTQSPVISTTRSPSPPRPSQPNIVFIMPDDMQFLYDERPAPTLRRTYGSEAVPNINRIRNEGTVFNQAYVAGPKCAPARFNVLTGRYCSKSAYARSNRASTTEVVHVEVPQCKIDSTDLSMTLQRGLRDAGYATIMSGKWHLMPESRDASVWDDYDAAETQVNTTGFTDPAAVFASNMDNSLSFSHNHEWMAEKANAHMEAATNAGQPFFLYFTPTAPHGPNVYTTLETGNILATPNGTLATSPDSGFSMNRSEIVTAASTVTTNLQANRAGEIYVDQAVGSLLSKLESLSILDNTLVIFSMDHGQAAKDTLYEGGTRVALFARYPGVIPAGGVVNFPVSNVDLAPTIFQAAGVTMPFAVDGVSWWPAVTSNDPSAATSARICIVSEIETDRAVVCPSMGIKYIYRQSTVAGSNDYPFSNDTQQLYNLTADPTEQVNLVNETDYGSLLTLLVNYLACHQQATAKTNPIPCDPEALLTGVISTTVVATGSTVSTTIGTGSTPSMTTGTGSTESTISSRTMGTGTRTRSTPSMTGTGSTESTTRSQTRSTPSIMSGAPTESTTTPSTTTPSTTTGGLRWYVIRIVFPGDASSLSVADRSFIRQMVELRFRQATSITLSPSATVTIRRVVIQSGSIVTAVVFESDASESDINSVNNAMLESELSINLADQATPLTALSSSSALTSENAANGVTDAPTPPPTTFTAATSSDDSDVDSTTIVIIAIVAVIVLMAVIGAVIYLKRGQHTPPKEREAGMSPSAVNNPVYVSPDGTLGRNIPQNGFAAAMNEENI